MTPTRLTSLLLLLLTPLLGLAADSAERLQLFLLIGQSNMAGRGKVEPKDQVTNPRILMLTKDLKWVPAKDPVHFDKDVAGVGLCSEFARTLVAADKDLRIGLIPCAVGGSSLDQWKPDGQFYQETLRRAREAMKRGQLAGILWHQGESDSDPAKIATYGERFSTLIGRLRKDLEAPAVPVVMGELGRFRPASKPFNDALPAIAKQVPNCGLATAEGLDDKGDKLHFDAPSQRKLGERYAAVYLKLKAEAKTPGK